MSHLLLERILHALTHALQTPTHFQKAHCCRFPKHAQHFCRLSKHIFTMFGRFRHDFQPFLAAFLVAFLSCPTDFHHMSCSVLFFLPLFVSCQMPDTFQTEFVTMTSRPETVACKCRTNFLLMSLQAPLQMAGTLLQIA